jgi:hypothetical protein
MELFQRVWKRVRGARMGNFSVHPSVIREIIEDMINTKSAAHVVSQYSHYSYTVRDIQESISAAPKLMVAIAHGFNLIQALSTPHIVKITSSHKRPHPNSDGKEKKEKKEKKKKKKEKKEKKQEEIPHISTIVDPILDAEEMYAKHLSMELHIESLQRKLASTTILVPTMPTLAAATPIDSRTLSTTLMDIAAEGRNQTTSIMSHGTYNQDSCMACLNTQDEVIACDYRLRPIISGLDDDSPATCKHLLCNECMQTMIDGFLMDAQRSTLECTDCKRDNVPLQRRHVGLEGRYMVDPSTFAHTLSSSKIASLSSPGKCGYLNMFMTVTISSRGVPSTFSEYFGSSSLDQVRDGRYHQPRYNTKRCPACRHCADGPLTISCPNLARCMSIQCLMVFCVHCNEISTHRESECPTMIKNKRVEAARETFDPRIGRTCPYPGCGMRGLQHYRDEGCHILDCPSCKRSFCYWCGSPKKGSKHFALSGRTCTCGCFCDSTCPCIPNPDGNSSFVWHSQESDEEQEEGGDAMTLRYPSSGARRGTTVSDVDDYELDDADSDTDTDAVWDELIAMARETPPQND